MKKIEFTGPTRQLIINSDTQYQSVPSFLNIIPLKDKNLRNSHNGSSLRGNPSSHSSLRPMKVLPIISKLSVKQQIAVKESISTTAGGNGLSARNGANDSKWHFTNNQKYGSIITQNNNHITSSRS